MTAYRRSWGRPSSSVGFGRKCWRVSPRGPPLKEDAATRPTPRHPHESFTRPARQASNSCRRTLTPRSRPAAGLRSRAAPASPSAAERCVRSGAIAGAIVAGSAGDAVARHRELVRRRWTYEGRRPGAAAVAAQPRELILRLAAEHPELGVQTDPGRVGRARDLAVRKQPSGTFVTATGSSRRAETRKRGQQVHGCLRRGIPFGGTQGDQDAGCGAAGEGPRGALGRQRPSRVSRSDSERHMHLERVLREYVAYYNTHRPHRSLEQQPHLPKTTSLPAPCRRIAGFEPDRGIRVWGSRTLADDAGDDTQPPSQ